MNPAPPVTRQTVIRYLLRCRCAACGLALARPDRRIRPLSSGASAKPQAAAPLRSPSRLADTTGAGLEVRGDVARVDHHGREAYHPIKFDVRVVGHDDDAVVRPQE